MAAQAENVPIILLDDLSRLVEDVLAYSEVRRMSKLPFRAESSIHVEIAFLLRHYLPDKWLKEVPYWPCLVTSLTGVGVEFLRVILELHDIDWTKVAELIRPAQEHIRIVEEMKQKLRGQAT